MKTSQHTPKIWTIEDFLSPTECQQLIELSERIGYEEAKINNGGTQTMMKSVRNNSRLFHDDVTLAETYWQRLQPHCPQTVGISDAIGLNERFRFYRYHPGERFKRHVDGQFQRNEAEFSLITFMVYLNDDFSGGDTQFDQFENLTIQPKSGMALCFFHDLMHEGCAVTSGVKYALRSDVMYRIQ